MRRLFGHDHDYLVRRHAVPHQLGSAAEGPQRVAIDDNRVRPRVAAPHPPQGQQIRGRVAQREYPAVAALGWMHVGHGGDSAGGAICEQTEKRNINYNATTSEKLESLFAEKAIRSF